MTISKRQYFKSLMSKYEKYPRSTCLGLTLDLSSSLEMVGFILNFNINFNQQEHV